MGPYYGIASPWLHVRRLFTIPACGQTAVLCGTASSLVRTRVWQLRTAHRGASGSVRTTSAGRRSESAMRMITALGCAAGEDAAAAAVLPSAGGGLRAGEPE
jgi:hypothetical protein